MQTPPFLSPKFNNLLSFKRRCKPYIKICLTLIQLCLHTIFEISLQFKAHLFVLKMAFTSVKPSLVKFVLAVTMHINYIIRTLLTFYTTYCVHHNSIRTQMFLIFVAIELKKIYIYSTIICEKH